MGAPLEVTLDKAGCATALREKFSNIVIYFTEQNSGVSTRLQSFKNAFKSLSFLGCCSKNDAELDCVKTVLFSRQLLS